MPNVMLTIPNVIQSVVRPIITDITSQIKSSLRITPEIETYFFSDDGHAATAGSQIGSSSRDPRFASKRMIMLDVEQVTNIDNLVTMVSNREEHVPIFEDSKLGVIVRPIYESTDVRLNFRFRTNSKHEAKHWNDDIAIRVNTLRDMFVHRIHYHYGLPQQVWDMLSEVYEKREAVAGYNQTFVEYIQDKTRSRLAIVGEGTGTNRLPVVPEIQGRIIGQFDFVPMPEKMEHEDELGTFMSTFTYKFTYDCPIGCNMVYPIMVHNQYLSDDLISFAGSKPHQEKVQKSFTQSGFAYHHFESEPEMNLLKPIDPYIRIPDIDEFTPEITHAGTATCLLVMMSVQPGEEILFNLRDLGDVQLSPVLLEFLSKVESPYLNRLYMSAFHISLYEDQMLCYPDSLWVDKELNVHCTRPLDLRKTYHVRLAIVTDLTLLHRDALVRMKDYPKMFVLYFETIAAFLRTRPDFQRLGDMTRISPTYINLLWRMMTGLGTINEWIATTKKGSLFQDLEWNTIREMAFQRKRMLTVMTVGVLAYNTRDHNGNSPL